MDNISLETIKKELKKNKVVKKKNRLNKFINRLFLVFILTLLTMIFLKANQSLKSSFYKIIYENSISFASINSWYESKFGSSIPFKDFFNKDKTVFNEN